MKLAQVKFSIETDANIPEGTLEGISDVCGDILDDAESYIRTYLENSASKIPARYLKTLKVVRSF